MIRGYSVSHPLDIPRMARVVSVKHGHSTYEFTDIAKEKTTLVDQDWWDILVLEETK